MPCSAMQKGTVRLCSSHISRTAEAERQNLRNGCGKNELCGIILVKDLTQNILAYGRGEEGKTEIKQSSSFVSSSFLFSA